MGRSDGSVIISTELDNKKLARDLAKAKAQIEKLEEAIAEGEAEKSPLVRQAEELAARLREARAEAARYKQDWLSGVTGADKAQTQALERAAQLTAQHDAVGAEIDKIDQRLAKAAGRMERLKEKAGEAERTLAAMGRGAGALDRASAAVDKRMRTFKLRMKEVIRSALVFTLISQGLAALRGWMGKVVRTNGEAVQSVARLKGALLTLAQPLVAGLLPAFTAFVNVLTRIVTLAGGLLSALFGQTAAESAKAAAGLYQQTEALEATGEAAKKAGGSLASFDEINQLSGSSAGGSGEAGGGGSAAQAIAPDFSFLDMAEERINRIADGVLWVASGFGLWKLSSKLPAGLSGLAEKLAGVALLVGGLILAADGFSDAWENGVSWGNLLELLTGIAAAAAGLYLMFGKTGAGMALVAGGAAMVVTAFRDIISNGANLQNTLMLIAGIVAGGLGFFLLTGSVIPLVVAGIASIVVAVLGLTGNLEEFCTNFKENILGGLLDFVKGVFTGDWELAWEGVKKLFTGVWNGIVMVLESAINLVVKGLNWLISQANKISFKAPELFGGGTVGINIPSISQVQLPRLATGAVIPPNREFLAVLGDQRSGINIETPLATMVQAFKQAMAESGGGSGGVIDITVLLDGDVIYRNQQRVARRHGTRLVEGTV